jgi:AcrR family transcriptional regulator
MTAERGLRERKKEQMRSLIADAARRLFAERSFEDVTVADVARAADVSEGTVFNYFPTKEDLVYGRMEVFEADLLKTIRDRPPGESMVAAFGRFVIRPRGLLASTDKEEIERLAAISRVIAESPALRVREREIFDRYTGALAALIAEEIGNATDDVEPWVIANAMLGVHRAIVEYARTQILAGARNPRLVRDVRAQTKRALAALEHGLVRFG